MPTYNPKVIEPRWQRHWEEHRTFRTPDGSDKPKYYILDMFPYPSGAGLHVGHPEGYTATDILARYKRMRGFNVLHPMGWDAFGLPAEQYAIETGTHPRTTTQHNVATFRRQIKMLGFSYDWDREVDTTDPAYFQWTQWIFLQLFDTWYDPERQRGRPIAELPVPAEVKARGEAAFHHAIDLRLGQQAQVALVQPRQGSILVVVKDPEGRPIEGARPSFRTPEGGYLQPDWESLQHRGGFDWRRATQTDASGSLLREFLAEGRYEVNASGSGRGAAEAVWVNVRGGSTTEVTLVLGPPR